MPNTPSREITERYLRDLWSAMGLGTKETSGYPALTNLLNEVGGGLKPKVRAINHPGQQKVGIPDFGLFTQQQLRNVDDDGLRDLLAGPAERCLLEVKGFDDDVVKIASTDQVAKYLDPASWKPETSLPDRKREDYAANRVENGSTVLSQYVPRRAWSLPQVWSAFACLGLMDRGATCFPLELQQGPAVSLNIASTSTGTGQRSNLSAAAESYLTNIQVESPTAIGTHTVAMMHFTGYWEGNVGPSRQDLPRIPSPTTPICCERPPISVACWLRCSTRSKRCRASRLRCARSFAASVSSPPSTAARSPATTWR